MKRTLTKFLQRYFLMAGVALFAAGCSDDSPVEPTETVNEDDRLYTVGYAVGSGSSSTTLVQSLTDLSEGEISFNGFGFEVPSTRTARIFTSADGTSLFDLDYGGGAIYKFDVNGGQDYTQTSETNVQQAIGTTHPRWTKISEDEALLHNVVTEQVYNEAGEYVRTVSTARLVSVDLEDLNIVTESEFVIPVNEEDAAAGYFVFRMDAPIVVGDKAYYGMAKRVYDPGTDESSNALYFSVETLVVDYPSLENPRLISTKVDGARGATNGYRTSVSHVDENGDIYQIITVPNNTYDTYILRIRNGAYDESYSFNLDELLGENTISNGWFYVADGIGYVPYANSDLGGTRDAVWSVARVDLYNNTATKLNLPQNLWLQQYQNAVVEDGKFYMAIAPLGEEGSIYIFDPASTSADGFTTGATLESGADSYYIGIY